MIGELSLKRVVRTFLENEWRGVLNECQRDALAKEIEFQWELAKVRAARPDTKALAQRIVAKLYGGLNLDRKVVMAAEEWLEQVLSEQSLPLH